jgi:hypothetical protein
MTEHPILFSGEMVRAILAGRKTQTRRVVKPQPNSNMIEGMGHVTIGMNPADDGAVWYDADCINPGREVRCPHGRIGDVLWVRETWKFYGRDRGDGPEGGVQYQADMQSKVFTDFHEPRLPYRDFQIAWSKRRCNRWRPSIHMPRWACRLCLRVTDIRVERLQDITEEDAIAEGVTAVMDKTVHGWTPHKLEFCIAWDSIYKNRGIGWDANPWVWAITFERIEVPV